MPSIANFRTFLAVVRHGSFAAAGKEIGLTAAAVALQMRALEQEVGSVLFDRGARSVVLNTAGRRLVPQVEDLVVRYETMVLRRDAGELSGSLVMGALVSALMGAFADALWRLKREHPRLEVKLLAGLSRDFAYRVEAGELDAAIVTQSPQRLSSSLRWTRLYTEPLVLIVPRRPHFALAKDPIEVLRRAPFIRFERQTWTGQLIARALAQARVRARDEMELNSIEAIVELVRQGFGVSIVPKLANVQWDRDRALSAIAVPGVDVERHVGLLERAHHGRTLITGTIKRYFQSQRR
jgi:DNA-binding transcriptional LysR family regulator